MTQQLLELLKSLVAIPSFSREETAAADFLQRWMTDRGLTPHRCGNNVWLESEPPSSKPVILLDAHLDTVKPAAGYSRNPFVPEVVGDRIYGLGTNDDGASLVSLLGAFVELCKRPQPYRLIFCASAEEEIAGSDGIRRVMGEFGPVSLGIIGEPTGMRMAVAEKGLLVLDCTAHGVSGHAARDEGVNALYKALDDIAVLRSYEFDRVSQLLGKVRMNVTMIEAGSQHNVIPAECRFVVDVRPNGEYTNAEIVETLGSLVGSEVVPRSLRHKTSSIPLDHPVVARGLNLGLESYVSPTSSDRTACDFATLKIGPGESSRSHTADEYIQISEISAAVPQYVALLDSLEL